MNPRPVICFSKQRDYEIPLPFHPPERYPELDFLDGSTTPENEIYADLRRMLAAQGYDREHFGSAAWSPLSDFVAPAGTIVLKPNFVRHYNEDPDGVLETVVTHPAVLRPLIDYALKAVGPWGSSRRRLRRTARRSRRKPAMAPRMRVLGRASISLSWIIS